MCGLRLFIHYKQIGFIYNRARISELKDIVRYKIIKVNESK